MGSLLVAVKAKMAIHAHEKVRSLLEGEYGSVFKGRSMDFDDLREYNPGDDIKDIDWKATARSGSTRIRRYIAVRKHNILLVVDTGRNMSATSEAGDSKRDVAVMTAGVLSYIALKHGDLIGLVAGNSQHTGYFPFKGTNPHAEQLLQHIQKEIKSAAAPGNIITQLEYIVRTMRRKMMLVVISDDSQFSTEHEAVLRRLRAQHEILWVTIGDTSGLDSTQEFYDIDDIATLPYAIRNHPKLKQAFTAQQRATDEYRSRSLERLGVIEQRVTGDEDIVAGLFKLLERKRHAKIR